ASCGRSRAAGRGRLAMKVSPARSRHHRRFGSAPGRFLSSLHRSATCRRLEHVIPVVAAPRWIAIRNPQAAPERLSSEHLRPAASRIMVEEEDQLRCFRREFDRREPLRTECRPARNPEQDARRQCCLDTFGEADPRARSAEAHCAVAEAAESGFARTLARCLRSEKGAVDASQSRCIANGGDQRRSVSRKRAAPVRSPRMEAELRRASLKPAPCKIALGGSPLQRPAFVPDAEGQGAEPMLIAHRMHGHMRRAALEQLLMLECTQDFLDGAAGEAMEQETRAARTDTEGRRPVVVRGTAAKATVCVPPPAEPFNQRAAFLFRTSRLRIAHCSISCHSSGRATDPSPLARGYSGAGGPSGTNRARERCSSPAGPGRASRAGAMANKAEPPVRKLSRLRSTDDGRPARASLAT